MGKAVFDAVAAFGWTLAVMGIGVAFGVFLAVMVVACCAEQVARG